MQIYKIHQNQWQIWLKLWEAGNEVIYGKKKIRKGESHFKLFTAKMFYKTLNALSDVEIP